MTDQFDNDAHKNKLTPDRQRKILELIEEGNYLKVAAAAVGVSASAVFRWINKGKAGEGEPYNSFYEKITLANAKAEVNLLKMVTAAAPNDWKAAITVLERRFFRNWAKPERIKQEISGHLDIKRVLIELPKKEEED